MNILVYNQQRNSLSFASYSSMMNNVISLLVIVVLQRKWAGVQLNGYVDGKELPR